MDILNIAAGKMPPLRDVVKEYECKGEKKFLINLDQIYYNNDSLESVESFYKNKIGGWETDITFNCNANIFEFLNRTQMTFDLITIYRFLEHVSFTEVLYFIYLLSTAIRPEGIVDIVVPNYRILAKMLLDEDIKDNNFERNNIEITTEFLNERTEPHASIWTKERAFYFWELEQRFKILPDSIVENFKYDGRDIYLRFQAKRFIKV